MTVAGFFCVSARIDLVNEFEGRLGSFIPVRPPIAEAGADGRILSGAIQWGYASEVPPTIGKIKVVILNSGGLHEFQ